MKIINKTQTARDLLEALGIEPGVHSLTIHFPPGNEPPTITVERLLDVEAGEKVASVFEKHCLSAERSGKAEADLIEAAVNYGVLDPAEVRRKLGDLRAGS